jgi:hypothetical protein
MNLARQVEAFDDFRSLAAAIVLPCRSQYPWVTLPSLEQTAVARQ